MPGTWQVIKKERRKRRTEGRKDHIFSILKQKLARAVSVLRSYSRDEAKITFSELLYN